MRNQLWHDLRALKEALGTSRQLQDWMSAIEETQQAAIDLSLAGNLDVRDTVPDTGQDWSDSLLERVYGQDRQRLQRR